jgi:hypothetical protein
VEVIGGLLAGNLGARLPDVFDPPTHPGHRSLAHGMAPIAAVGMAALRLCRLGAGALAGLSRGYGSHMALDARTNAGLPLRA